MVLAGAMKVAMPMRRIHTIAEAYHAISIGERPWTALGNFMNEWFEYSKDRREQLVAAPVSTSPSPTDNEERWAAFCAVSVEWLCARYDVPCPSWVHADRFRLQEPWFLAFHPERAEVRERLLRQTPEPFARRNIFCGDRMFANKYEFAGDMRGRTSPHVNAEVACYDMAES
jgi:hypothetical protein